MFGDEYENDGSTRGGGEAVGHRRLSISARSVAMHESNPGSPNAAAAAGSRRPSAAPSAASPHTVKEIIATQDEEQEVSGAKGGCCSRLFIPFIVLALIVVVFVAIIYTNGSGSDVEAAPRVAVIVLEGFSGTVFHSLMQSGVHLPNIATMLSTQSGVWAECATPSQSSCARAVVVEKEATGEAHISAGAAMTSIFSGVSPHLHRVTDRTVHDMSTYASTSKTYPSFVQRVRNAGKRVTVLGSSLVLNSLNFVTGSCSDPGVLDMECGESQAAVLAAAVDDYTGNVHLDCLAASSANVNTRISRAATDPSQCSTGYAEMHFTRQLKILFGGLAYPTVRQKTAVQDTIADNLHDDLFVFHFNALSVRAGSADLPEFQYNASSQEYVGQAYVLDAQVGQVLSYLQDRSRSQKENWLVIGVADHGGSAKNFTSSSPVSTAADAITFFMATYTSNTKGNVALAPFTRPTTQLDVLPTVLTWLGVAPYDAETNAVVAGTNTTTASATVEAQVAERKTLEGTVQGICGSGTSLQSCAA